MHWGMEAKSGSTKAPANAVFMLKITNQDILSYKGP